MGANCRANDNYAIQWASKYGYLKIVKFLTELGAECKADNDYAIRCAASNGHLEVVKFLIEESLRNQLNRNQCLY